jgi:hypothetical protein
MLAAEAVAHTSPSWVCMVVPIAMVLMVVVPAVLYALIAGVEDEQERR